MEKDCFSFVRKCHQCQVHGDFIHAPPTELHPMSALWLFVAWGMDVIGTIESNASNGHIFILVAIDYFTKWVEAITLKSVTKKVIVDFVHSNLICRFGIHATIITDNAANLNSHLMREICEQFEITHQNSTLYHPKANGVVEAANKNIKKILRKMIQSSRWSQSATGSCINKEWPVPPIRKVRPRNFKVGQLVLRSILPHHQEAKGKFAPNWKGPYIIRKLLPKGELYPETAVNAYAVKRCNPKQPCKKQSLNSETFKGFLAYFGFKDGIHYTPLMYEMEEREVCLSELKICDTSAWLNAISALLKLADFCILV
ncbi:uncharacterized protein [Nicotiana sylvestris]|uniref:uncharacterized protein n=1 Tax=Nicotiana sylvestris TaxID=4096 RepID=UPI00388C80B2